MILILILDLGSMNPGHGTNVGEVPPVGIFGEQPLYPIPTRRDSWTEVAVVCPLIDGACRLNDDISHHRCAKKVACSCLQLRLAARGEFTQPSRCRYDRLASVVLSNGPHWATLYCQSKQRFNIYSWWWSKWTNGYTIVFCGNYCSGLKLVLGEKVLLLHNSLSSRAVDSRVPNRRVNLDRREI